MMPDENNIKDLQTDDYSLMRNVNLMSVMPSACYARAKATQKSVASFIVGVYLIVKLVQMHPCCTQDHRCVMLLVCQ